MSPELIFGVVREKVVVEVSHRSVITIVAGGGQWVESLNIGGTESWSELGWVG